MACEAGLLGGFRVRVDGKLIEDAAWTRRRAAELVKILALQRSRRLHRDQIMEALWHHLAPEAASANLRKAIYFARRTLGSGHAIAYSAEHVELWPHEGVRVDAVRFEDAARAALENDDPAAAVRAAYLYAGELLPEDRYADWADEPRERLRMLAVRVFKAGSLWERVLDIDPADEEAHQALMKQALESGDRTGAIRQFQLLREHLRLNLGVGPDAASVALYEKALSEGEQPPNAVERARALLAWGVVHMKSGDLDQAERDAIQAENLASTTNPTRESSEARILLGIVAHTRGQWADFFRADLVDAVNRSEEISTPTFDAHLCIAEFTFYGLSSRKEITTYARDVQDVAGASDSIQGGALAELLLGEVALISDRLDEAEEYLTEAVRLHHEAGSAVGRMLSRQRLADVAVAKGEHGRARRLLRQELRLSHSISIQPHCVVRMHEGLLGASRGPAELKAVQEAEAALAGQVVCQPCSIGYKVATTKALARSGRITIAQRRLEDAEQLARMWPRGPWHAAIWEARGELRRAQADEEAAAVMFREAANLFANADRPRDEARCLHAPRSPVLTSKAL